MGRRARARAHTHAKRRAPHLATSASCLSTLTTTGGSGRIGDKFLINTPNSKFWEKGIHSFVCRRRQGTLSFPFRSAPVGIMITGLLFLSQKPN